MFSSSYLKQLVAVGVSSVLLPVTAVAQQSPTIESITVVGKTTNTEITPEQLELQQANDLADIFRQIPSVDVGGSLGIAQKVYIRGVEDTLLNVTVDGAQQTGTLFHHIGRVAIEPELLDTVEVQTGAGEATSGFGAIGGAIRFKTKDASDLLDTDERFGGSVKAGYFSNDGHKANANLFGKLNDDVYAIASYVTVDRNNMQDGDGNTLFGTAAEQSLGFVKLNTNRDKEHAVSISYERRDEQGEFGARPNWPALEGDTLFPIDGTRDTVVANYFLTQSPRVNLQATAYYTTSDIVQNRFDRWGAYQGQTESIGADIRNLSVVDNHRLTYGVELRKDTASSQYLAEQSVWGGFAWDPNIGQFEEKGDVYGAYIQDHWQLSPQLLLSAGLRFDRYELEQTTYGDETSSSAWSPNIGLNYQINDFWAITVGHARAMRGKEVGDAFTLERDPSGISIAPDLAPEKVANSEFGVSFANNHFRIDAAVYRSTIDDVIFDQVGRGTLYENIGEFVTKGAEINAGWYLDALRVTASFSINDAEINGVDVEGYEHIGLGNTRGDTLNLNVGYLLGDDIDVSVNLNWVNDLDDIEVLHRGVALGWIDSTQFIDKPGYTVVDAYLRWTPTEAIDVNVGIQNLFDRAFRDHTSVGDYSAIPGWEGVIGLNEAGRDVRVSLVYRF